MEKMIQLFKKLFTIKNLLITILITLISILSIFTIQYIKITKNEKLKNITKANEMKILDSISKPKKWNIDTTFYIKELKIKNINFKTKYNNGKVYYKFYLEYDQNDDPRFENSYSKFFTVDFLDKDNFKLHTINIKFSDFSFTVENGKKIGVQVDNEFEIDKNSYFSFSSIIIGWIGL